MLEQVEDVFEMNDELKENLSIADLKGSYAGAMGMGQFIPSSFRRYAIDFDLDGNRDLWGQSSDAIGSVGNYLYEHGWRRDEVVAVKVDKFCRFLVQENFSKSIGSEKINNCLEKISEKENISDRVVRPLELAVPGGYEYWFGFWNFSVLTKYNRSNLYAMAVYQLSEALKKDD